MIVLETHSHGLNVLTLPDPGPMQPGVLLGGPTAQRHGLCGKRGVPAQIEEVVPRAEILVLP